MHPQYHTGGWGDKGAGGSDRESERQRQTDIQTGTDRGNHRERERETDTVASLMVADVIPPTLSRTNSKHHNTTMIILSHPLIITQSYPSHAKFIPFTRTT